MLTFGSLFAGIGGFDLGFERAGMRCRWQVEIDPRRQKLLSERWPEVGQWDDVRTFPPHPADDWSVDVICGGFPCQDVSRNGLMEGINGARSGLFVEAVRIIRELRPRITCLENVAALLDGGLGDLLGALASIGYYGEWDCIPAAAVGSDQIRERIFILAYPQHGRLASGRGVNPACKKVLFTTGVCEFESPGGYFQTDIALAEFARRKAERNGEPRMDRVAYGVPNRMDRISGLGNSVHPDVAEWIGRRIVGAL